MNSIAIDVASEVSSVCILRGSGKLLLEESVPTKIKEFRRLIKLVNRPRYTGSA